MKNHINEGLYGLSRMSFTCTNNRLDRSNLCLIGYAHATKLPNLVNGELDDMWYTFAYSKFDNRLCILFEVETDPKVRKMIRVDFVQNVKVTGEACEMYESAKFYKAASDTILFVSQVICAFAGKKFTMTADDICGHCDWYPRHELVVCRPSDKSKRAFVSWVYYNHANKAWNFMLTTERLYTQSIKEHKTRCRKTPEMALCLDICAESKRFMYETEGEAVDPDDEPADEKE